MFDPQKKIEAGEIVERVSLYQLKAQRDGLAAMTQLPITRSSYCRRDHHYLYCFPEVPIGFFVAVPDVPAGFSFAGAAVATTRDSAVFVPCTSM